MWKWLKEIMFQPENMTEEQEAEYNDDHMLFWIRITIIAIMTAALVGGMCWVSS